MATRHPSPLPRRSARTGRLAWPGQTSRLPARAGQQGPWGWHRALGELPLPARGQRAEVSAGGTWLGLWRLVWPLALAMLMQLGVGLADTWIAGQVSPAAQAVVGLAVQGLWLANALAIALGSGAQALVARLVGAEDWRGAARVVHGAVALAAWSSLALALPLAGLAPTLLAALGGGPWSQAGGSYLGLLGWGLLPMNVGIVLQAVLRARGAMRAQLVATAVEAFTWLGLSLGLALGLGWGLEGLAWAFVVGKAAGALAAWRQVGASRLGAWEGPWWHLDLAVVRRVLRVGLPSGAQGLVRSLLGLALMGLLGWMVMPQEAIAAHAIGHRLEAVAYLPLVALSLAASTVVGQSLGAQRPEAAARACWRLVGVAMVGMALAGALAWRGSEALADAFTSDPLVWTYTRECLRATAAGALPLALSVVLNGALQGSGATRSVLACSLGAQALVALPLAYAWAILADGGPAGVWWAMATANWVQALAVLACFLSGRWARRGL